MALGFLLLQKKDPDSALEVYEEAKVISPEDGYVKALGRALGQDLEEHGQTVSLSRQTDDILGVQSLFESLTSETGSDDDAVLFVDTIELDDFLRQLFEQAPLMQSFFSGSADGNADLPEQVKNAVSGGTSELALVAADRAGLLEGPEGRALIDAWAKMRPSSYSVGLLDAAHTGNGAVLDRDKLSDLDRRFPEHKDWNDWLRLPFVHKDQRNELLSKIRKPADDSGGGFWGGRLNAVYPNLDTDEDEIIVVREALRRLVDDIAMAEAEPAVPSVA
ncbi:MAG: hypothetical protein GVY13_04835 [Alphaproteobacteria bacterium]|nr:hypothetical protein [Alphaproteobacteria bacterium]